MKANVLSNYIIGKDETIEAALGRINDSSVGIVFVCDDERLLLGSVSDGDIRRALLDNFNKDIKVIDIMNKKPVISSNDLDKRNALFLMNKHDISVIPIVKNGKLCSIYTLKDLIKSKKIDNPVFIMAGGFGTRLRPLTDNCPKPLLKVGGKPILEIILKRFIDAGFFEFYISTHYLPEMIHEYFGDGSKWNVSITYVHEDKPLGTGGALGLLPRKITQKPLIMINGDVLTNLDINALLEYHQNENALATMCVREYDYQIPYGVVEKEGNKITAMTEKPKYKFHVNAGIYVVSPKLFNSVDKDTKIDMPSLLESNIKNDENIVMYPLKEYWLDIGQMTEYKQAQKDIISLGL
ncbi:nucleotidyltransferase family protein [Photobacterium leiognathi]|uniref:nucleotidyltransferase family protein n=1 Tax=Photobacterium leiognathi TaxID=553611 RepID=UPI00298296CE|nr:nucleotidyltransferase family protein [Photobacterium leiognathi]